MKFKNICDCHNHSNNSYDAVNSVHEMCARAKELNFLYHAITDHCECDEYYREVQGYQSVVKNAYADMQKVKEEFPNLLMGIEVGQIISDPKAAREALEGKNYDVIIASVHRIKGHDDFYYWKEKKYDPQILIKKYFQEILSMLHNPNFDTLAHLTYPCRYMFNEDGSRVNFNAYSEQISEVFKKLIDKNVALEVNTSGLRQDIGEVLPNEKWLRLYKDLGGSMITMGSDAHCVADLGKGLNEGMELLSSIGFKHITVFKERQPIMVNIE